MSYLFNFVNFKFFKIGKLEEFWAIVSKISSELSRESLLELYHFRQQNSDVDLDKYFDDLSGKLKEFIQENLRQIELEEGGRGKFSNGGRSPVKATAASMSKNSFLSKLVAVCNLFYMFL